MNRKCRKRRYRDEIAAKIALASCLHRDSSTRDHLEQRVYYHAACRVWHLTSAQLRVDISA